ncbi:MAG: hypothetical protein JWQ97_729 [Phenylobacterium sp.]|nr:hypothetical protein [Phenylobacterium sp.]
MKRLVMLAAVLALTAGRAVAADPAEGEWLVQDGEARVRIAPCPGRADRLCGVVVWLKAPRDETGQPKHDAHNPDASLRSRPIIGLPLIRDFNAAGGGRWEGGKIYDPKTGRTYAAKLRVGGDGTLKVDGCVIMFCQTQTWTRAS